MENFTIQEHSSSSYAPRTYFNATQADLTIALAVDMYTAGEKLTHKAAGHKYLGFELNDDITTDFIAQKIHEAMSSKNLSTINIAGNGIYTLSKHNCNQEFINDFVFEIINHVHQLKPIKKIFTGGQTGVDLAGAVAAFALEIPALITLPKGYKQRFENKIDIEQKKEDVLNQIINWSNLLNSKKQSSQPKVKI